MASSRLFGFFSDKLLWPCVAVLVLGQLCISFGASVMGKGHTIVGAVVAFSAAWWFVKNYAHDPLAENSEASLRPLQILMVVAIVSLSCLNYHSLKM